MCKNLVLTFSIMKIINIELLIHRTAALYIGETPIRVETNEVDQVYHALKQYLDIKMVRMRDLM